jgi:hypothetical protein
MTSFMHFLQSECAAIKAYIESGLSLDDNVNDETNLASHISSHPRLQEYFGADILCSDEEGDQLPNSPTPWSRKIRGAIIDHLVVVLLISIYPG